MREGSRDMPAIAAAANHIVLLTPFIPALTEMLQDKDPKKSQRVMKAMLQMDKMDIAALKQAIRKG